MNTEKIVKGELPADAKIEMLESDREYRRPEVHDLGKLELLQFGDTPNGHDGTNRYIWRP